MCFIDFGGVENWELTSSLTINNYIKKWTLNVKKYQDIWSSGQYREYISLLHVYFLLKYYDIKDLFSIQKHVFISWTWNHRDFCRVLRHPTILILAKSWPKMMIKLVEAKRKAAHCCTMYIYVFNKWQSNGDVGCSKDVTL